MKRRTRFHHLMALTILGFGFITSCRVSAPRTHHVPLFEEKGEMLVAANVNLNAGAELQVDYAVGNHIYLMTDFSHNFPGVDDALGTYRGYYGTLGLGAYNTYGKYGRIGVYGGPTYGRIDKTYYHDSHMSAFLGVDWGMARPKFETALSLKFSQNWLSDVGSYQTYEPAWTIRFGGENLKFQSQFGLVLQQGDGGFGHYSASFGFNYRLRTIKK